MGVPCNQEYINWLGFITIPFLAFVAFTLITVALAGVARSRRGTHNVGAAHPTSGGPAE